MKNHYQLFVCFLLCVVAHPAQSQFNCRYDPTNTQIPNTVTLPYNVTSIAANSADYLSTVNYTSSGGSQEYHVMDMNVTTGAPGLIRDRTTTTVDENANSIVYAHNGANHLKAGSKDNSGSTDMYITKNDVLGNAIWARYMGVSAYTEEALLIVQDDASYGSLGSYLVVGVSNRYGTRSPYIARIEDVSPSTMAVVWQKTYNSGLNIDEIPTSVHQKANGDYVIAGHTEGSSVSTLFTFEIDITTGGTIGNWVNYHVSSQVDETNAYIQRSQSGAGGYVMSYTVGDASGSAIGVMEIDNSRNNVFWNNTYYQTGSNFNHSVAIHWNGSNYVVGTGHFFAGTTTGVPGFLTLTTGGVVSSLSLLSPGTGTFLRTQSMIQTPSNDYLMKVLYDNLDGYGLIKTNSTGGGAAVCGFASSAGTTPLLVDPDPTSVSDDVYSGLTTTFESPSVASGDFLFCTGSGGGTYLPKQSDRPTATVEEWDVPSHQLAGSPTSVASPEATEVTVFPNPSNGSFQVQFEAELPLFYEVTDMSGKTLVQGQPTSATESIELQGAKAGIYLLRVQFADKQWTQKISVR